MSDDLSEDMLAPSWPNLVLNCKVNIFIVFKLIMSTDVCSGFTDILCLVSGKYRKSVCDL